jgi:hypothetical protein
MAYSDLRNKLEAAGASLVTALAVSGLSVYQGSDDDEQALPKAVCIADNFDEAIPETGNYNATLHVRVVSNADDTSLATHNANVAAIFDKLLEDTIPASLSAAVSEFYCHGVRSTEMDAIREGRTWVDVVKVNIMCCAKDV